MGTTKARPRNPAAEGLIADMNEHLESIDDEAMLDAVLLAGVQKLEHYCIAAWGTARALAKCMGEQEVVQAMERELEEGKRLDQELTRLAERQINPAMLQGGQSADGGGQRRGRGSGTQESRATH
jgi:ferritin-like metal-binding protein YciE